jgi:hypothetical protein
MNSDINTNVRLFDLVRFMRSELHEAELITDEEYSWLLSESPMTKGKGSPSPRRLEDYDEIRAKMKRMESALRASITYDEARFERIRHKCFGDVPDRMKGQPDTWVESVLEVAEETTGEEFRKLRDSALGLDSENDERIRAANDHE